MTARYLEGAAVLSLVLFSTTVTAKRVQQILCPRWRGAPRLLLRSIIGLTSMIVIAEVLGLAQLFRLVPYLVASVAVATSTTFLASRHVQAEGVGPNRVLPLTASRRSAPWWEPTAAVAAVSLVVAEWSPGTVQAYRTGMTSIDTIWYHMPFAAQFAQSGSITGLQNINNDNVIAFYPASSEVVHAIGIVLIGNDLLSPLINLVWLAIALLAGWCIGVRFGVPCLTLLAVACVMGTTEMIADEPGTAYNDVVGIALVVAALAILANLGRPWDAQAGDRSLLISALPAGFAVGVKYPFAFPVLTLAVIIFVSLPKGRKVRIGVAWCFLAAATGVVWYVRNLIDADNPVPNLHFAIGPVRLSSPPSAPALTVAHFFTDGSAWRTDFIPGLSQAFGPADIPLLVLAAAGLIVGVVARPFSRADSALARIVGVVGIVTLLGYLITPQPDLPGSFVYDLRFTALGIVMGLIALPIALCRFRWVTVLTGAFVAILVATQFASGIWSSGASLVAYHALAPGLIAGTIALLLGVGGLRLQRSSGVTVMTGRMVATTMAAALIVGGYFIQSFYLTHRYTTGPQAPIYRWADTVHHARIGVSGLILNYPLYGNDLSNSVEFVGDRSSRDYYAAPPNCVAWRQAIDAGHFDYIVVSGSETGDSADGWTRTDRSAHLLAAAISPVLDGYARTDVFAVRGRMHPGQCGRQ